MPVEGFPQQGKQEVSAAWESMAWDKVSAGMKRNVYLIMKK